MKTKNLITFCLCLGLMALISCKSNKDVNETVSAEVDYHKVEMEGDRKGPPRGDRKGPPKGEDRKRRGPRGGKGGSPEQTRSIEEIGGYKIGATASDFALVGVNGKKVSLSDYSDAKGYIVTFTCNDCPFSVMYEDRLIEMHNKYAPKGYPVIAINSNSTELKPGESLEKMTQRAKDKSFPFVYLKDADHSVASAFGAVRTPHMFILDGDMKVQYIGAIDDNARDADGVTDRYVENAIAALQSGKLPETNFTKSIGCPIASAKH